MTSMEYGWRRTHYSRIASGWRAAYWRIAQVAGMAGLTLLILGCNGTPAGITRPKFDPAGSTARALKEFDANGDQKLNKDELQKCPGLLAAIGKFDQDRDGTISAGELETNLREIEKQGAGLVAMTCDVRRGGQPIEGATVKFIPEGFLAGAVNTATGVTGPDGSATPSVADDDLPQEIRGKVRGVPSGVFRVEVTHPSISIPAKFNTETTVGRLVTRRDHDPLMIEL